MPEGLLDLKCSFLALAWSATFGRNPTLLTSLRTPSPQGSMMVVASCSSAGTEKLVGVKAEKDCAKYSSILKEDLIRSARDLRLRQKFLLPPGQRDWKYHPEWVKAERVRIKAQTSIRPKIRGVKWLFTNTLRSIWLSLNLTKIFGQNYRHPDERSW